MEDRGVIRGVHFHRSRRTRHRPQSSSGRLKAGAKDEVGAGGGGNSSAITAPSSNLHEQSYGAFTSKIEIQAPTQNQERRLYRRRRAQAPPAWQHVSSAVPVRERIPHHQLHQQGTSDAGMAFNPGCSAPQMRKHTVSKRMADSMALVQAPSTMGCRTRTATGGPPINQELPASPGQPSSFKPRPGSGLQAESTMSLAPPQVVLIVRPRAARFQTRDPQCIVAVTRGQLSVHTS